MVIIENEQDKVVISDEVKKIIDSVVTECLKQEEFNLGVEVSVLFVDNEEIRRINEEYREIDSVTDVLSFPMVDFSLCRNIDELMSNDINVDMDTQLIVLGDIIISAEKALEQAQEYGHSVEREFGFLTAHSVFHLLGYDHMTDEDSKIMRAKEESALAALGLNREE